MNTRIALIRMYPLLPQISLRNKKKINRVVLSIFLEKKNESNSINFYFINVLCNHKVCKTIHLSLDTKKSKKKKTFSSALWGSIVRESAGLSLENV